MSVTSFSFSLHFFQSILISTSCSTLGIQIPPSNSTVDELLGQYRAIVDEIVLTNHPTSNLSTSGRSEDSLHEESPEIQFGRQPASKLGTASKECSCWNKGIYNTNVAVIEQPRKLQEGHQKMSSDSTVQNKVRKNTILACQI